VAGSGGGLAWSTPRCCLAPRWGPPLGGLLLALDGWQGVFLVNLPLLVVPLVVSWRWIPARRRASSSAGFDLSGAALLCASLVALAWLLNGQGLSQPARLGRVRRRRCCVRCGFMWRVLRHPDPVLDLRLFRRGPLSTASGAVALSNLAE
jgi:MFS transporter, DHA2 family, multidrug resistance protein